MSRQPNELVPLAVCICIGLNLIACDQNRGTGIEVTRATIGEQWPFQGIEQGTVECDGGAATFV